MSNEGKKSYLVRNLPKIIITVLILLALLFIVFVWGNYEIKRRLPIKYEEQVLKYSAEFNVDKNLVYAIIAAESSFDKEAESRVGAKGLMQLMPDTAEWLKEKYSLPVDATQLFDENVNIMLGTCYISYLLQRFDNDVTLVIAAYNGGEGNVKKWLKDPRYSSDGKTLENIPFEETSNYVKKVSTYYQIYEKVYK